MTLAQRFPGEGVCGSVHDTVHEIGPNLLNFLLRFCCLFKIISSPKYCLFVFFTDTTDGITPTVGFLTSSFTLFRYHVTILDLGGGPKIRAVWKNYYAEVSKEATINNFVIFMLFYHFVFVNIPF